MAATVIYVDDVPEVVRFYETAFGLTTRFADPDVQLPGRQRGAKYQYAELAAEGGVLAFATPALGSLLMPGFERSPTGAPEGVEVAFYTDDVPAAFERAVEAGAKSIRAPEQMPWGQLVAYVQSHEGTFIGICAPPAPEGR